MKGYLSYDGKGMMRLRSEDFKLDLLFSVPHTVHHIKKIVSWKDGRLTLKLAVTHGGQPMPDLTETYDLLEYARIQHSKHASKLDKLSKVKIEGWLERFGDYLIERFTKDGTAYIRVYSHYSKQCGLLLTDGDFRICSSCWGEELAKEIRRMLSDAANGMEPSTDCTLFNELL